MKFKTNWRVGFYTPNDRQDIDSMAAGKTFADAACLALDNPDIGPREISVEELRAGSQERT